MALRGISAATEYRGPAAGYRGSAAAYHVSAAAYHVRIGLHTFGCKLNQYETEALASMLRAEGCEIVDAGTEAEVYILNTCTITSQADHKARAMVRALSRAHPDSLLVVTGCSAQLEHEKLRSLAPRVLVIPQSRKAALRCLPRVLAAERGAAERARALDLAALGARPDPFALTVIGQTFRTRTSLKIQDGCSRRCAYCRVPLARGGALSLPPGEVLRRAAAIEARGSREIVLTGVNISAYAAEGVGLERLVSLLLAAAPRVRFRLTSLEPDAVTEDLAAVLSHRRVCPHFHLPIQSGADSVLARMGRRYDSRSVRQGVALLRSARENPFVAADIIAGFPGETAKEHAATMDLVGELALAAVHVFPFSPRPGTAAFSMRPAVPERVRTGRVTELRSLAALQSETYARAWVGREAEVLFERPSGAGMRGVSANYLRVEARGLPPGEPAAGRIGRVMLTAPGSVCTGRFTSFCR